MSQLNRLQTPFLQPDLVTVSSFISYCRDNSVLTDKAELEYFDKEQLLVPAVRVLMGVVRYRHILADFDGREEWRFVYLEDLGKFKYKKLDPKTYYGRGALVQSVPGLGEVRGFHFGNDGWMDWYANHKMVRYPSNDGYIPWKRFQEPYKEGKPFGSNPKLYEEVSELMYAKHQIYPLKFIKNRRTLKVVNQGLFRTPEAWSKAGNMITKIYSEGESNGRLQQQVKGWNRFFDFYMDIRRLRNGKNEKISEVYKQAMDGNGGNHTEAAADAWSAGQLYDKTAKEKAKQIAARHKFSVQDIEDWRYQILGHGSFGTGSRSRKLRNYVAQIDNSLLNKTEDAYAIVNELSWFIELLGGTGITAKQLVLNSMGDSCKYCGKHFESTRITQVTCGAEECKKKQRNEHKRQDRRLKKARGRTKAL